MHSFRPSDATASPAVIALIVAAGRGVRAGGDCPKQYRLLGGRPVLSHTLGAFLAHARVDQVQVVIHPDDHALYADAVAALPPTAATGLRPPAAHAEPTRAASVRRGIEALGDAADHAILLIHDAARPFVDAGLIGRAIDAAGAADAAVPVVAITDTVKRVDAGGIVVETLERAALRRIQTPQAFRLGAIRAAHAKAAAAGLSDFPDDGAVIEWAGGQLATFAGDDANIKLTTPEDFVIADSRLGHQLITRVATGYDVHAFTEGDHVWLGGVRIPHGRGVKAHSDGDVALHALCDAIFGLTGDGDIGQHFPPSDPRWRGASSDQFLAFACGRLAARGGVLDHLDLSIVCEAPRIGPHRDAMRARIAAIAGVSVGQVGVKATTSEKLGFIGRAEGLAALATVTARLPLREGAPDA
jgi:2-C-methyl-D-erythritol 4-phosphate cytidylyltransferase/2-C-methyl-D-erythritol 2,4-cyclodiphosphate synthase